MNTTKEQEVKRMNNTQWLEEGVRRVRKDGSWQVDKKEDAIALQEYAFTKYGYDFVARRRAWMIEVVDND
jgi:hypothetical protein